MHDYVYMVYRTGTGRFAIYKNYKEVLEAFKHLTSEGRRLYSIERKSNPMKLDMWMEQYGELVPFALVDTDQIKDEPYQPEEEWRCYRHRPWENA